MEILIKWQGKKKENWGVKGLFTLIYFLQIMLLALKVKNHHKSRLILGILKYFCKQERTILENDKVSGQDLLRVSRVEKSSKIVKRAYSFIRYIRAL